MALNEELQPLSTLGQPLTGEVQPAATLSAVEQLVDAYHKGFVTTNDILAHSGQLAAAQNKSALDLLKISPDLIEAKKSEANLAAAQSKAQLGLLPQATELAQAQTARAKADVSGKASEDEYDSAGLPRIYTADGTLDHAAMQREGGLRLQAKQQLIFSTQRLVAAKVVPVIDPETKQPRQVWLNAMGQDVTPPYGDYKGGEAYQHFAEMQREAQQVLFGQPNLKPSGVATEKQPAAAPAVVPATTPSVPSAPAVVPLTAPAPATAFAAPPVTPLVPIAQSIPGLPSAGAEFANMPFVQPKTPATTTIQHPDGTVVSTTAPTAPAAPVIQPKAAATGGFPFYGDTEKALTQWQTVQKQEPYSNWSTKVPAIDTLKYYSGHPRTPGGVSTQDDFNIAKAVLEVVSESPSMRGLGPEAQLSGIHAGQPLWESVKDLKNVVLKKESFSPGVRERLLRIGLLRAQSLEAGAAGVIKPAANLVYRSTFVPPESFLSPAEKALLTRGSAGAAPATGTIRDVNLGGKQYRVAF